MAGSERPDVILVVTDQERAVPAYEADDLRAWRDQAMPGRRWFAEHGVSFGRHYTGSVACVPSRPTLLSGHYPDVTGVTQTDGLAKSPDDSRMRWMRPGEVPTLGHWFRAGGYDTHYVGKWHVSHADLMDPATGEPLATNLDDGTLVPDPIQAYLDADVLDPFGFSGWVGPEPHGAAIANCGLVRDPIFAARAVSWLHDRYARRRAGEVAAARPFLLVASFVNPHDIVFWPVWAEGGPLQPRPDDPPRVGPSPTDGEDLGTKPRAQAAYREAYPSGYGPAAVVRSRYDDHLDAYRWTYHRLHLEVDDAIDQVRRAVTEGGSQRAVLVRTSDHGEVLGAHGGLHQKWFNLYDECIRVPFEVVRTGTVPTAGTRVEGVATSHVDLLPTLVGLAGLDGGEIEVALAGTHSEVHPLPGRDLTPFVDVPDRSRPAVEVDRAVYVITRDNILEGDTGASGLARRLGRADDPPPELRVSVAADVGANIEAMVVPVPDTIPGGHGHLWKVARYFDDPATWTEPGVRHLTRSAADGDVYRTEALPDEWELYDLDADPFEAHNRWTDAALEDLRAHLRHRLATERQRSVPARSSPWPYAPRRGVLAAGD